MGSNWSILPLEKIATVIDSRHKTPQYTDLGYPMVRVVDVKGGELSLTDTKNVTADVYADFSKGRDPEIGDLIISRVGSYGNVSYVSSKQKFCLGQNTALIIPKDNSRFLYYALISPQLRSQIDNMAVGAVQKTISLKSIKGLDIPQPPVRERIRISSFLSSLDDKITLNRQINQTLEQMAQTLFKSWFVDFDPVVDNALDAGFFEQDLAFPEELLRRAEARKAVRENSDFKPLPEATRQLFPAAFEECAEPSLGLGGWVPQGWAVKCVSEAITINPKVNLAKNKVAKFVDMKALPTQGYSIEDVIEKPFTGGMKFQSNDVLLARITPCLQNGKTGIVDFLSENEAGFGSTEFIILRGNKNIHHTYIACLARYENFRQHVMQSMVGSSGRQRVQNGCFDDYQIAIPSIEIMSKFASLVLPSFKKFRQNTNESIALANLRDTLLPKLISGELLLEGMDADLAQEGAA